MKPLLTLLLAVALPFSISAKSSPPAKPVAAEAKASKPAHASAILLYADNHHSEFS